LTYQQILTDLKNKRYQPIYFLHGSEPYFIDLISDFIEKNVLNEGEKAFNQTILYGKEIDHLAVVDAARRYPMMSSHQVIIIKEAQEMKTLKNLESYFLKPLQTTILVICHKHKRFNTNSKFGKLVKGKSVFFDSKKLWDNQVPDWIRDYLRSKSLKITSQGANLMAEFLGTDLSKITNELEKLIINLPKGTEITNAHIEEYVGISREYNIFELQKAIGAKDIAKVNRIVNYFISNPKKNPLVLVVGTLFNYFSKIYMFHFLKNASEQEIMSSMKLRSSYVLKEYRVTLRNYSFLKTTEVLNILKEFDLKSKGVDFNNVGKPDGALLKEMTWRILH
jgi:DNA polymerase-3 subunit delta